MTIGDGDQALREQVNWSRCWALSVAAILSTLLISQWFVSYGGFSRLDPRHVLEGAALVESPPAAANQSQPSPSNQLAAGAAAPEAAAAASSQRDEQQQQPAAAPPPPEAAAAVPAAAAATGAAGEDEAEDPSCLSRRQHLLMRNASSIFNLPPGLSQALLAHEEMQGRCSRKDLAKALLHPDPEDKCKYLVFLNNESYVGLGNHILSLVSAFLYALLTNRMLLMDTRGHLSKLLCDPFPNSSWLLPPDFPYDRIHQAPPLGDALDQDFKFGNVVHLMLMHQQSSGDQQFFCEETQSKLANVAWIGWSSSQYFVPRLFAHPSFWKRLVSLFPNTSLVFTHLSRYLLLPRNEIWGRIRRAYSSYLSSPRGTKVGLQIRLHHTSDPASFDSIAYERITQCLVGNGLLPNVSQGKRLPAGAPLEAKITKVFIASLQVKFYEAMKKKYIESPTIDGGLVEVVTLSHDGVQSASFDQAADAFVEMWLLSFSDVLVTSSWSTFGYVAQGLGALRPRILNIRGEDLGRQRPACMLSQSIEPCNHYPFLHPPCKRKDKAHREHDAWIRQHIRQCQDETRGIQLV